MFGINDTRLPQKPRQRTIHPTMVRCEYCRGVVPQLTASCPNCGAPIDEIITALPVHVTMTLPVAEPDWIIR